MRTMLTALIGVILLVTLAQAEERCAPCESPGRCEWVTEMKKTKKVVYSEKESKYCRSTIAANSPAWAAFLRMLGHDDAPTTRTKTTLMKRTIETETPIKVLKPIQP